MRLILAGLVAGAVLLVPVLRIGPEKAFHAMHIWVNARVWPLLILAAVILLLTGLQRLALAGRRHVPLAEADPETLGPYSAADLERLLDEVRAAMGKQDAECPSIFISRTSQALAMTVNSWLMDHKPRLNAVYLSEALLQQLDREELKAIIAHECAHFYRYMSPHGEMPLLTWFLSSIIFLGVGPLVLDALGGAYFTRWYHLLTTIPGVLGIWTLITGIKLRMEKGYEFLADLDGARIAGPLAMINALLKVGTRQQFYLLLLHAMETILQQYSGKGRARALIMLESIMPRKECTVGELREQLAEALDREVTGAGGRIRVRGWKRMAVKLDRELVRDRKEQHLDALINWKTFDTHVVDGKLDEVELQGLLKALSLKPGSSLFNFTLDRKSAAADVHPKMRERILFVALNCGLAHE